jgi:hypothetical protein
LRLFGDVPSVVGDSLSAGEPIAQKFCDQRRKTPEGRNNTLHTVPIKLSHRLGNKLLSDYSAQFQSNLIQIIFLPLVFLFEEAVGSHTQRMA